MTRDVRTDRLYLKQQAKEVVQGARPQAELPLPSHLAGQPETNSTSVQAQKLANPQRLSPDEVLTLQRMVGNQAVQRLLRGDDAARASVPEPAASSQGGVLNHDVAQTIQRARGTGTPLPQPVAAELGKQLGGDVTNVKVHAGGEADRLSRSLNAEAFTVGNDLFFRKGAYQPHTHTGKQLLAHELTHAAQQRHAPAHVGPSQVAGDNTAYEHAAKSASRGMALSGASGPGGGAVGGGAMGSAVVQRKMSFQSTDLSQGAGNEKTFKQKIGFKTTWDKLLGLLSTYETTSRAEEELLLLQQIQAMAMAWLGKHARAGQKSKDPRVATVRQLLNSVLLELPHAQDQASYMSGLNDLRANKQGKGEKSFQFLQEMIPIDNANMLASGGSSAQKGVGRGKDALEVVEKYKLTDAEIAALQIYSGSDFTYINPAMSTHGMMARKDKNAPITGLHQWLNKNLDTKHSEADPLRGSTVTPEQRAAAKEEGKRHGKIAMEGLAKLPDFKGKVYRGATLAPGELGTRYKVGQRISYNFLTSSSKDRTVSEGFTRVTKDSQGNAVDGRIGMLMIIQLKRGGKDISMLSMAGYEKEVLWQPGLELVVTKVIPEDQTGKPYAIVEAAQVLTNS